MKLAEFGRLCWLLCLGACAPTAGSKLPEPVVVDTSPELVEPALTETAEVEIQGETGAESAPDNPVPIERDDAVWGPSQALVTVVWFTDLQGPFCKRVLPTLQRLLEAYGSDVRIVVKHNPLPFHKMAKPAALAATAVLAEGGDAKFVRFMHLVFERQRQLAAEIDLVVWAGEVGVNVQGAFSDERYLASVDADIALAKELGTTGVPAFRINGLALSGAQPFERFSEVIDEELVEAKKLERAGHSLSRIYDERATRNAATELPKESRAPPKEDLAAYQVPVGNSPALGPADALVTMIEFAGYQCPFCGRVQPTLRALRQKYKSDLRIVFKHNPLPFHKESLPAAKVALEVFQKLGSPAFWQFSGELFDHQKNLAEPELYRLATQAGLSKAQVKSALSNANHERRIDEDQQLAADFNARGTPYFFINGVRLTGAQPQGKFETIIDRELEKARAFVQRGIPKARVYAEIMKTAKPPDGPELKPVPPVKSFQPRLGSAKAPVTLHLFADLECPFCARLFPTLLALEKQYRGKLQIVWFDLPLPFHRQAVRDAIVAHEVKSQRGDATFWKFVEALFSNRKVAQGADAPLVALAATKGANASSLQSAIDQHKHRARVEYGEKVAKALGISGTPASIINGYYLSGAQPARAFERLIDRALKDHKARKKPVKLDPAKIK